MPIYGNVREKRSPRLPKRAQLSCGRPNETWSRNGSLNRTLELIWNRAGLGFRLFIMNVTLLIAVIIRGRRLSPPNDDLNPFVFRVNATGFPIGYVDYARKTFERLHEFRPRVPTFDRFLTIIVTVRVSDSCTRKRPSYNAIVKQRFGPNASRPYCCYLPMTTELISVELIRKLLSANVLRCRAPRYKRDTISGGV